MAYSDNELATQGSDLGPRLRVDAKHTFPKTFASGTGTIALLAALTFNTSTGFWQVFSGTTNEVNTFTAHATTPATAGDFTITVGGQETAAIAFDATAADIQAALELLSTVAAGDVVAVATTGVDLGDASAVVTLTWGGLLAGQDITITTDMTGISAGSDHVLATTTAGGADAANGTELIKGFAWPDPIVLAAANEVIGQVLVEGTLDRNDVPLVTGSYGQVELDAALRTQCRDIGIHVQGLDQVH